MAGSPTRSNLRRARRHFEQISREFGHSESIRLELR